MSLSLIASDFSRAFRLYLAGFVLFGVITGFARQHADAQWTGEGATLAGRHGNWMNNSNSPFSPNRAIGASGLAFAKDGTLYMTCEKVPYVLAFPESGGIPDIIELRGIAPDQKDARNKVKMDIEAISIHGDKMYLMDEDDVVVYEVALPEAPNPKSPGKERVAHVKKLTVRNGKFPIDKKSLDPDNSTNLSSIEGLVVTETPILNIPGLQAPYFYLLDECDDDGSQRVAKLYVGSRHGDTIQISDTVVAFDLYPGYRLPELFEFENNLYAIRSAVGSYEIVRLDLEANSPRLVPVGTIPGEVKVNGRAVEGFSNNYEGAAVHPDPKDGQKNGRLFISADNESFRDYQSATINDKLKTVSKSTPLITLPRKLK